MMLHRFYTASFAPMAHVGYFSAMQLLQGHGFDGARKEVSSKFWDALKVNYFVWPLAIFVNVTFVPLPYRVLFVNIIGLGYGGFLSYAANDRQRDNPTTDDALLL